jgi:hypothetical protein
LVPIIILALLNNKGILPDSIYYGLTVIIAFIGGYFFWLRFGSIITRDNMDYQTYDWYFDPASAPTAGAASTDPWSSSSDYGTCIGDACCSPGLVYDFSLNQCVPGSTSTTTTTTESFITEGMVQSVLTKSDPNKKYKGDVMLNSTVIPSTSNSFIYKK